MTSPSLALERAGRELRFALRGLLRAPGFTVTALLILGLGIGLATALFTVLRDVLVAPLPVLAPGRIVVPRALDASGTDVSVTPDELKQLQSSSRTLRSLAGVGHQGAFESVLIDGDRPLTLRAAWVTGSFFRVMGTRPLLGRFFGPEDEPAPGAMPRVLVLGYDAWRRQFGGDPHVIGRTLGNPYTKDRSTIIGVAPPGLAYPVGTEYWTPVVYGALDVVARLAPGASVPAAREEFRALMRRLDAARSAHGVYAPVARVEMPTLPQEVLGDVRPRLLVLAAAVALLLLIACVNVSGLVLLRATARESEFAVRRSLGATAADIVRPLAWESGILALAGGALGLALAAGALRLLVRLAPDRLPRLDVLRIAPAPLGLAAATTAVALVLAALVPALLAARGGLAAPLRLDARAGRTRRGRRRLRHALVAGQVALALVMLAGAGLLARSLDRLTSVPLGYRPAHLSILTVTRQFGATPTAEVEAVFERLYDRLAPELRALPGVVSVTPVDAGPFYGPQVFVTRLAPAGESAADAAASPYVAFEIADQDYFRTFGIRILRGRGLLESDRGDRGGPVVVSRSLAQRLWPRENPVGKQLRLAADTAADAWRTVVGEAEDIRYRDVRQATPSLFLAWRGFFFQGVMAIRTRGPLATELPALRRAVAASDPAATLARAQPMDGLLADQVALPRLSTVLLSALGLAALLLAAIGLYGIMAAAVRERTHELGVRAALGATPARLRAGVLAQAGRVAVTGGVVGFAAALVAGRFLRALLFQVGPDDPVALLGALGLLLLVALAAALLPAWRATRADPMRALRAE